MDGALEKLVEAALTGGPAVLAILMLFIIGLLWERNRLLKDIKSKEGRIDDIVDDYHKGNLTVAEAMNSLKCVLHEIKGKL